MRRSITVQCSLLGILLLAITSLSQAAYTLATMPRVDTHCHISDLDLMEDYLKLQTTLREKHDVNLEVFIDLLDYREERQMLRPGFKNVEFLEAVEERYKGRFLITIADYQMDDGLDFSPEELPEWLRRGVIGYKMWVAMSPLIDDPANDPTFTKMEQIGMVGAAVHISQPYPSSYCDDIVKFWEVQNTWERVLDRHPNLIVVQAHMLDHFNSDEQLDYLIYVLETYPNVHLDISARFQQFHRMSTDKLRDFMIRFADRIMFGTDVSLQPSNNGHEQTAESYVRCFKLLETDEMIDGGFFDRTETKGLKLPLDVLEKIYFRNAARIYPRVGDVLKELGYEME
ncbi:amidohydrolase family protein [candidate division KSB1 bacterium]